MTPRINEDGPRPVMENEHPIKEAATWLIQLQEEPEDAALRGGFDAWLEESAANRAAWAEIVNVYDIVGETTLYSREQSAPAAAQKRRWYHGVSARRAAVGVVATALAAALALALLPGLMLRLEADYVTDTSVQRDVALSDGTVVTLAPRSAIKVDYDSGNRHVRLLEGKAFFEVAPDAAHPFRVDAQDLRITVLGTGFEVRSQEAADAVHVRHGRVQVEALGTPAASRQLGAGEWLEFKRDGQHAAGQEFPDQVAAWRSGQLVALDRTVASIVEELRPYFRGVIIVADEAVGTRRVTGLYDLRNPEAALDALAQAHKGTSVLHLSPWLMVISGS